MHITFIDFEKAFDSIKGKYLCHALWQYCIPENMLNLIQEMCRKYERRVIHEGNLTEGSKFRSGVRQNYTNEDQDLYV
jgi:hypothetical protein